MGLDRRLFFFERSMKAFVFEIRNLLGTYNEIFVYNQAGNLCIHQAG